MPLDRIRTEGTRFARRGNASASAARSMTEERPTGDQDPAASGAAVSSSSPLLVRFARAFKASTRIVGLYPPEHPNVTQALTLLTDAARVATSNGPLKLGVMPDSLVVGKKADAKPDAAVAELAALMHSHLLGEVTVNGPATPEVWRRFLGLLAAPPDKVRSRGGLARAWSAEGRTGIDVKEIDYGVVLRERMQGDHATWESIIANCLDGEALEVDDETLNLLLAILDSPSRVSQLEQAVEQMTAGRGMRSPIIVAGLMRAVAEMVSRTEPDRIEPVLDSMSEAAAHLSLGTLLPLLNLSRDSEHPDLSRFITTLMKRMRPVTMAQVVARSVLEGEGPSARLAQAFSAVVPEIDHRKGVLDLAHQHVQASPAPKGRDFDELWTRTRDMLLQYSDENWVSDSYAAEFAQLQAEAVDLDLYNPDPPERVSSWVGTVSDRALHALDASVVSDLLRLETDSSVWRELSELAVSRIDDLVLRGDLESATMLVMTLVSPREGVGALESFRASEDALERLLSGPVIQHLAHQLEGADEQTLGAARRFCEALGPGAVPPLAEALSIEERQHVRVKLVSLLTGFGSVGRPVVEKLRQSPNSAVRRTAVQLLREFGGQETLPELKLLLDDAEPDVQRDATRAIALLGSNAAFGILAHALWTGSNQARSVITATIWAMRDESAPPLLEYLVSRVEPRGVMRPIYERAVQRLAAIGGDQAVGPLKVALYRGQWWAPFRTSALRATAADALARIGTEPATRALEEAASIGPSGVRRAARAALAGARKTGGAHDR
jgi:HEAT repeat protein